MVQVSALEQQLADKRPETPSTSFPRSPQHPHQPADGSPQNPSALHRAARDKLSSQLPSSSSVPRADSAPQQPSRPVQDQAGSDRGHLRAESVPMSSTRVVMHQIVLPGEVDTAGVCFGGQVSHASRLPPDTQLACSSQPLAALSTVPGLHVSQRVAQLPYAMPGPACDVWHAHSGLSWPSHHGTSCAAAHKMRRSKL